MIKVTYEFASVEEAIVALGKLVGTASKRPVVAADVKGAESPSLAVPATRRGRSDKGQARGSYKNPASNQEQGQAGSAQTAESVGNNAGPAVTAPSNAAPLAATLTATPAVVPAVPGTQPVAATFLTAPSPEGAVAAAALSEKDAQAAISKLFDAKGIKTAMDLLARYGCKVVREMKADKYGAFVADVERILAGGDV